RRAARDEDDVLVRVVAGVGLGPHTRRHRHRGAGVELAADERPQARVVATPQHRMARHVRSPARRAANSTNRLVGGSRLRRDEPEADAMDTLFLATLGDMLVRGCVEQPERTALVIDDRRWTYAQLHERAVATARSLRGLGVRKGDHVAVFMPNCIEFLEVLFGATYLGAVTVPINARFRIE